MALSRTRTSTQSYTRARMQLVCGQFVGFAERFRYSGELVGKLPHAVERRWVDGLTVYANDSSGQAMASVELRIDWLDHDELKETGSVSIDSRWKNEIAPQIGVLGQGFEEWIRERHLDLDKRVGLAAAVRNEPAFYQSVMDELGLREGSRVVWSGNRVGHAERLQRLAEMTCEIEVVD